MPLPDLLFFISALIAAGLFAGLTAGMFGVGGGMVVVPVMLIIFKMLHVAPEIAIRVAIGTSLATIIPTALSSLRTHARHKAVDYDILKQWSVAVIIGAALGSYLAAMISGHMLRVFFACVAFGIASYMTFAPAHLRASDTMPKGIGQKILASIIGFISALVGVGGGSMAVPTMVLCGVPIHRAVGTASAIGILISLPATLVFMLTPAPAGLLPFGSIGHVNWLAFAILAPASMLAAPYGARLAHRLHPLLLRRIFASYLVLVALKMALSGS